MLIGAGIEMSVRADGRLTSKWPKTINPEEISKQLRGHWLRERPDVEHIIKIKIPIIMRKVEHGGNKIHIDVKEFSKELAISSQLEDRLTNHFGVPFKREIRKRKTPEERIKLAQEYQKLIEDGTFKCKADLARHLNVSRAWITKAMKVKNT